MIHYCSRHKIGFNGELDPVCPQCTLSRLEPAPTWEVDQLTLDVKIPLTEADKTPINLRVRK